VQWGLGLGFAPSSSSLFIPMNISKHFRLEPEIGFSSGTSTNHSITAVSLACGFFYLKKYDSLNFYGGIRLGLFLDHQKVTLDGLPGNTAKSSQTDILIGPAIGAEYLFAKRFSLGGEFQFNYSHFTNTNIFDTRGLMFIRWYFN
jgi:hypothetical protein